ncbi:MAG: DUF3883 domain-containing protein [Verrucomicrobia bacterium]|nr:DUF3883 domain-containing protein [Verrucomicrobiota bacterium]MCH8511222.1 DUF3883 domain-containing protein [Kiritimatiellia bacterium]
MALTNRELNKQLIQEGNRYLAELGLSSWVRIPNADGNRDVWMQNAAYEAAVQDRFQLRPGGHVVFMMSGIGGDKKPLESFRAHDPDAKTDLVPDEEKRKIRHNIRVGLRSGKNFGTYVREFISAERLSVLSTTAEHQRVLFARVGYMKHYAGVTADDPKPVNGGSYNEENVGYEIYNFKKMRGSYFGYVQPKVVDRDHPLRATINLGRIDPSAADQDEVKNVLVVFVATVTGKGQVVVGFYRNATVYRHAQSFTGSGRSFETHYNLWVNARNAFLIPPSIRTIRVPRGRGGMGQSNVRYILDDRCQTRTEEWITGVLNALDAFTVNDPVWDEDEQRDELESIRENQHARASGQGFVVDAELKKQIELHAMEAAEEHFRGQGYVVDSSVCATRPFDLLCRKADTELHVEVKGTTTNGESVILTRNEVMHAHEHPTALFILSGIRVVKNGGVRQVSGGKSRIFHPWSIEEDGEAIPTHYRYNVHLDNSQLRGD